LPPQSDVGDRRGAHGAEAFYPAGEADTVALLECFVSSLALIVMSPTEWNQQGITGLPAAASTPFRDMVPVDRAPAIPE
jgi:hypothetical protein